MENLKTGQFFGQTNEIIHLDGLTLTDTEYTHSKVDWHYHENAYFTFILEGSVIEGNRKETYHCDAGSLLFHNWQDAHYNIKPDGFTRGFHIELDQNWYRSFDFNADAVQGSVKLVHPQVKILMYNIFRETKLNDTSKQLAINTLLIDIFSRIVNTPSASHRNPPGWVNKLKETLHDSPTEEWSLHALALYLDIHPVHLSRDFTKYFNCNLGEYLRNIKIQRSLAMLSDKELSLTDIALECGFSDQSHFIRCFKASNHINPSHYRKLLLK
ncbi:helix-turn-helix domain-containing protein [Emticicia sp. CRIBPO]|uniref:AraC family transcriptional regulator n=1 Tax=Emticicia sp. CRIBPO TaxID=2683258 RepID=UPI0014121C1B|nr:AraC family transcriptional regulator [Emticicia sp. CRIBPO]NBA84170.1 helix-turn-helix domain-containing protein [Emticicia sp. CRIBPO]